MRTNDIVGKKFGKLKVISFSEKRNGRAYWNCLCDCGNYCIIERSALICGKTKSCGCYKIQRAREANITHGQRYTRLYSIYNKMIQRCYNKNNPKYKNYGMRGILICDKWLNNFTEFYNWAINNGYTDKLTIERINVNKGYEPANCKWIPAKEQAKNRTTNIIITISGEKDILSEWCKKFAINYKKANYKYHKGYSINEIFNIKSEE